MKAEDKLSAKWSKNEEDILLHWPGGIGTKSDASFLSGIFNDYFIRQMSERGYDITTMKFSIEPKKGCSKFDSQKINP